MRTARRLAAAAGCAAAVSVAAQQASAPQDAQRDARQAPIRTQANYVRVDVYPTSDGRPVQDLGAGDFEVLEDGVPQAVEDFQYITVSPAGPQAQRLEPNTVEASRQAAADPRGRLFVIFLDVGHVTVEGAWNSREPLIALVNRVVGDEDVVGIMTPEMSAAQIAFARRTEVIERGLRDVVPWGKRHTMRDDPQEQRYQACYPVLTQEAEQGMFESELVTKMKARRRERLTFDALRELSMYLRTVRNGRSAVIAVTEGWRLYRPDPEMTRLRKDCECRRFGGDPKTCGGCKLLSEERPPGVDPIGVGPGGRLGRGRLADAPFGTDRSECDRDRVGLAQMDNETYFRTLVDDANRANVSFYPIDPRGLPVFDAPLGPGPPPTLHEDQANLKARHEAMHNLAAATDGLAVIGGNDLNAGLKRISDDLTSYYLLGYYSTNARLDGRFRKIAVRVKRPGVSVRARRGYRAPTEEELAAARTAAPPEPPSAEAAALTSALEALARIRPDTRFRIHAAPAADAAGGATATVWVAGELQPPPVGDPWTKGGAAEIDVSAGDSTASGRAVLAPGERTFLTAVRLPRPVSAGALDVRARLSGNDPGAARLADSIHLPMAAGARRPVLFRRGPTTGARYLPAATFLFSRTERVRVEVPVPQDATAGAARLLDRTGKPVALPVAVTERAGDSGQRWIAAEVTLAPLGAGDYVVEVSFSASGAEQKVVTAIRVAR